MFSQQNPFFPSLPFPTQPKLSLKEEEFLELFLALEQNFFFSYTFFWCQQQQQKKTLKTFSILRAKVLQQKYFFFHF